ncbi:cation efflux protein [Sarocladium strictum]
MVGKRGIGEEDRKHSYPADQGPNGHLNGNTNVRFRRTRTGDLEAGKPPKSSGGDARPRPRLWGYHDSNEHAAEEDARREELKGALLKGIDRNELERYRKSSGEIKEIKNKQLRKFYEDQNCRLNDWLEVDAVVMAIADDVLESMNPDPDHDGENERNGELQRVAGNINKLLPEEEQEKRRKAARKANIAIQVNVVANVLLLAGKGFAALTTGSLSLIASLVDSALDLLCTLIVWSTNKIALWRLNALKRRFPVGRRRLEPLGILVFSIIMVLSFAQILQESVGRLMPPHAKAEALSTAAIASLLATIVIKGIIGICCYPIKTTQVQALVQDCKTDAYFNTLSLLFPLIGYKADVWWLDPVGAGLLSLYIIYDWGHTSFENVVHLSGEAADDRTLRKLTYLAYRFSPVVTGFKAITAYHAGDGVWVEFDLLLDEKTPLNRSHDIAETLQYCAEGLAEVDRAFVTTDYAVSGPTGHATDAEPSH